MNQLPITSLFVAGFCVALVALSIPVTVRRITVGLPIGGGDDPVLMRRVRAQGNFIEYVPLALIALALAEFTGASRQTVFAIGATLSAGRALHAVGTYVGSTPLRGVGMIATYVALVAPAAFLMS